ncbi:hypothetical protein QQS45_01640 [Alteriqipengyuania flavescens]|nr:hypothetical protein [Alteriqipengyuania flavescens]WJY24918.1 hypothetical protein QQS45_01640 [Alteriqipengyuania flavescens]
MSSIGIFADRHALSSAGGGKFAYGGGCDAGCRRVRADGGGSVRPGRRGTDAARERAIIIVRISSAIVVCTGIDDAIIVAVEQAVVGLRRA